MTDKFVGLEPAPSDEELVAWLRHKITISGVDVLNYLREFEGVYNTTIEDGEPKEFAYARLLNNLATLDAPVLLHMIATMIWEEFNGT